MNVAAKIGLGCLAAIAGAAVLAAVVLAGWIGVYAAIKASKGGWMSRAQAQAALAKDASIDLVDHASTVEDMESILGPPERRRRSVIVVNTKIFTWDREAVRAEVLGDTPVTIEIGAPFWTDVVPFNRAVYPGPLGGLRLGGPPASTGVDGDQYTVKAGADSRGRLRWIRYQRSDVEYNPASSASP
jgi:hypothetical protein